MHTKTKLDHHQNHMRKKLMKIPYQKRNIIINENNYLLKMVHKNENNR